jgi:hypothetical protein
MAKLTRSQLCERAGCLPEDIDRLLPQLKDYRSGHGWRAGAVEAVQQLMQPSITGLTVADRLPDGGALWQRMIEREAADREKARLRYSQQIVLPGELPCGIAFLSDLHLGNAHCAYTAAARDAEIIRQTPGLYSVLLGDLHDNWISQLLGHVQREQPVRLAEEMALLRYWLERQQGKLLAVVAGNHELRSYIAAGLDWLASLLEKVTCLYDQHEIRMTLRLGEASWRVTLRHKYVGHSKYNQTHGQESYGIFEDPESDICIGGHRHTGTLFREWMHGGRKRLSVALGTYLYDSPYARQIGKAPASTEDGGCGCLIFYPDGRLLPIPCLRTAAKFLTHERTTYSTTPE